MANLTHVEERIVILHAQLKAETTRPIGDYFAHFNDPDFQAHQAAFFTDAQRVINQEASRGFTVSRDREDLHEVRITIPLQAASSREQCDPGNTPIQLYGIQKECAL